MRIRPVLLLPALLLLPLALSTGYAEPRAGWNLAARVPASCVAFVSVEEIDQMRAREEKTALGRLAKDPAMQPFLAPLLKALEDMATLPPGIPPSVREILKLGRDLRGQAALAFLGMEQRNPLIVASLDFGPKVAEFGMLLQRLVAEVGEGAVEVTTTTKDGRPWWTASIRGGPTLSATIVDTTFVVATSPALLATVTATPASTGTLATSPEFLGVLERIGKDGLAVLAYANVPAALAALGEALPPRELRMAEAFGLDTVKAVAYGMSYAGEGYRDTLLIHAPAADHGLIPMFRLAPIERPRLLGLVPGNAFAYAEANVGLDNVLASVRKVAALVDDDAPAELDRALKEADAHLGVSVEKDVLGGLAGTLGWYGALPQGGGLFPELALMATVKDPAAYEGVLNRLAEGIAGAVNEQGRVIVRKRTLEYEGQRLHMVELWKAQGDDVIPFTPSWTLLGDRLVVTLVPYTLKEIVWRAKHADAAGPGLEAQEDFRSLWAQKPATAGSVSYFDLQAVLSILYDTGVPLLQTLAKPNLIGEVTAKLPLDWAALPPARVLRPYLRSMMGFESWGPDGIEMRLHAPIPLMAICGGAALFGATLAVQASPPMEAAVAMRPDGMEEVVVEDEQAQARRDVQSLTSFVNLYLLEEQALPTALEDLVKKNFIDPLPRDPWGRAYRFVVTDAKARTFQVRSDGPDGEPGTADDVSLGVTAVR
jgi:hypothetical protein